jgi:hypothetical protein
VQRPKASKDKIHSKNEFELCYLRHQYFRKVKYNPTAKDMEPFMRIAAHLAKNTFYTYQNLFHMVGLEVEDVVNISRVHLTSFLGLFSLEKQPQKYKDFIVLFKKLHQVKPDKEDILDKNQANFTLFLKQRMEEVVRICRQKARNIKGLPSEEFYFYCGPKKPPKILRDLIKNYETLGYKKLDLAVYRSVKKKAGSIYGSTFQFGDNYYVAVPLEQKSLQYSDFIGAGVDPRDNMHNMNPEDVYLALEDDSNLEQKRYDFLNSPTEKRINVIRNFINVNKKKVKYREEVKIARKLLKKIG